MLGDVRQMYSAVVAPQYQMGVVARAQGLLALEPSAHEEEMGPFSPQPAIATEVRHVEWRFPPLAVSSWMVLGDVSRKSRDEPFPLFLPPKP